MKTFFGALLAILGFGGAAALASGKDISPPQLPAPTPQPKPWPPVLNDEQMVAISDKIDAIYNGRLSQKFGRFFVPAAIKIESAGDTQAGRYESHLDESSLGLMQLLPSTAKDVHANFNLYPLDLLDAESNVYHGYGYLVMLCTWGGVTRSEEWTIRGYNGGPGWQQASEKWLNWTQTHWNKHQEAKAEFERRFA